MVEQRSGQAGPREAVSVLDRVERQRVAGGHPVPCTYCRMPIAAGSFAYLSSARRLLGASCPACERHVTVLVATWRRVSGLPVTGLARGAA